jgi:hypothetical protein
MSAGILTGLPSAQFTDPYGASSGLTYFTNPCTGTGGYLSHAFLTCNIPSPEPGACTSGTPSIAGGVRFCGGLSIKNATVDLVPSGGIGSVAPVNNGSGYTSTPTVTFSGGGGSGAAATATVQGKKVISYTLTSPGSGYTSAPTITISGGGGSGATATATVSNGVIWITDGDLALQANGVLECTTCNTSTGAGVTIIFTTTKAGGGSIGAPTMQSNPTIDNLSAPTSGTYAGLLMVQDTVAGATYTTSATFQGTPGQTLNGLVYTPNSNLLFQGNPSVTNSCLLVVANQLSLKGNSTLATGGCPATFPLPEVKNVALAS